MNGHKFFRLDNVKRVVWLGSQYVKSTLLDIAGDTLDNNYDNHAIKLPSYI